MKKPLFKLLPIQLVILALALLAYSPSNFAQTKSSKRGLGYGYHSVADMNAIKSGISWWYNWHYIPDAGVTGTYPNSEVAYVPMAWDEQFNVEDMVAKIPAGAQYLLAFNEPNFKDQANMTPQEMAALWPKIEEIARRRNLKIVSPAVNFCGNCTIAGITDPVVYLDQFFAACPNCKVDYISLHWYSCYRSALEWYINMFKKFNRPIWVTELACWEGAPTIEQQKAYMTEAVDLMENDPMVFRYAWFTGRSNGPNIDLFSPTSGQLTELGKLYISLPFKPTATPTAHAIPSTIQAEIYTAMFGVANETTADADGGQNVAYIETGDWMDYNVNVATAGSYKVSFRVASTAATGQVQLRKGTTILATVAVPNTGGWQTWTTISANVTLTAGTQTLRVHAAASPFNINWIQFTNGTTPTLTNLALKKPVTVSSTENTGTHGANAVDGNATTRWASAFSDPQWIQVDLGATYSINRVKISWEGAYGKNYTVQTSTNGTTWTTIKTITNNTTLVNDHTGLSASTRYVRINGTARATGWGYSIFELEVYGPSTARISQPEDSLTESITFFPNPVQNLCSIKGAQEGSTVIVKGSNGLKIYETKVVNSSFNLSALPDGLYIVELKVGEKMITKRVIKKEKLD